MQSTNAYVTIPTCRAGLPDPPARLRRQRLTKETIWTLKKFHWKLSIQRFRQTHFAGLKEEDGPCERDRPFLAADVVAERPVHRRPVDADQLHFQPVIARIRKIAIHAPKIFMVVTEASS